jgi:hypothetical protein
MNNTKTRTLAIVAVLTAATLVVGVTFAATTTQSVFAYQKNKGGDENSKNGNTVTPQTGEQYGIQSGFDNSFNQELQNMLCTHPSATCSTEGSEGASHTTSSSSTSSHSSPSTSSHSSPSTSSHSSPSTSSHSSPSTSSHSSPSTSTSSSAQQRLQGLKQDTSSPISPSSSCTVGSFGDLVQTICIPLPMP